jgi:phosphatidylglycerophosphate synthase
MRNPLASLEKRCLVWIARRLPRRLNSDHLTLLAISAMLAAGLAYLAARFHRAALAAAVLALAVNWFGDSLDGTLARVRRQQRPRYGFYVDHIVDCFGVLFLVVGLGLSGYMSPLVAAGVLIAFFLLLLEVYLATYCLTEFRLSFWGVGPTELRILLAIGTIWLMFDPRPEVLGRPYRLFDVGGVVGIAGMIATAVISAGRNVRALYLAEPIPPPSGPPA